MSDPISDMLTRIRNAGRALLPAVELPHSRMKESVAKILKTEGYVADVAVEGNAVKKLKIRLKYQGKKNVIEGLKRVSRPGLRRYVGENSVAAVAKEPIEVLGRGFLQGRQWGAVGEEDVGPAIAVIVEDRHAAGHGFRHVSGRALIDFKMEGEILELESNRRRRLLLAGQGCARRSHGKSKQQPIQRIGRRFAHTKKEGWR